jgi:hypothetical protein
MSKEQRDIRCRLRVLRHAEVQGNSAKTCWYFGIARQTFCNWKSQYEKSGAEGLINHKPCPENPTL